MDRRYTTVDVFTEHMFGGNPLAVVLDAQNLSAAQMQSIAAEFNYAESTFVLPPRDPQHTAQVRIEFREKLRDRVRKLDADEEPFRAHSLWFNSQPDRDASPSMPPGGGNTVLITFIMRPAMFGKTAFPRIVARAISGIVSDGKPRRHAERIRAAARSALMEQKGKAADSENQVYSAR